MYSKEMVSNRKGKKGDRFQVCNFKVTSLVNGRNEELITAGLLIELKRGLTRNLNLES
jgi:hypothetical protein